MSPLDYLPYHGFQMIEFFNKEHKIRDLDGYCLPWTYWYLELRINNSSIPQKELVKKVIEILRENVGNFKKIIRSYSYLLISKRDHILKKIGYTSDTYYSEFIKNNENFYPIVSKLDIILLKMGKILRKKKL